MLKRLEMVGFKSFADKTTFDFGDGITAVVGPNGSGKSNIVDAVRWMLGEQSAKSLRGGEMADVIFNGSTSRRGLGLAEVTMTMDNRRRLLATEADEVQITRRVYRSGEGEYLINQQPCRLKDIKDLFLGSGAGSDAYCIIEQGKVDVLLQASNRERRTIFEEAAGISRFKARKVETLRKLERVDQNLQRLQDIIDEVEKQLRSVKLQAAKAERYQEYTNRLRELRLALGLEEFHRHSLKLQAETTVLDHLKAALEQRAQRASAHEEETRRIDVLLTDLEDQLRREEARLADVRQVIKTQQTTLAHEDSLTAELETELSRTRLRLNELATRLTCIVATYARVEAELSDTDAQAREQRLSVQSLEAGLSETVTSLAELQHQVAEDKVEHLEQMRQAAHLQNEAVAAHAQLDNLSREQGRLRARSNQASESLASIDVELRELSQADEVLQAKLNLSRQTLAEQRQERERLRQFHDAAAEQASSLRQERSGIASRVDVLQGLIRSHEGLGTGVRELFALLEKPDAPPWGSVLGMVADFLTVRREYAPLIDLALGEWAQRFVVRNVDELMAALAQQNRPFTGRVSFVPLQTQDQDEFHEGPHAVRRPHASTLLRLGGSGQRVDVALAEWESQGQARPELATQAGVVAVAEQLVSCENPELAALPARLLGRTLIVRDLPAARAIAALNLGYRLVTLQGELLEADGTMTVGAHHAETGVLSRKSELRELVEQAATLDQRIADLDRDLAVLRERGSTLDRAAEEQQEEIGVLTEQAGDLRGRLQRHRDRRQGLHEEVTISQSEIGRVEQEMVAVEAAYQDARTRCAAAEERVQLLHDRVHRADDDIRALEQQRQQRQRECTAAHVALAKIEEKLTSLSLQHQQLSNDLELRREEQRLAEQGLTASKCRHEQSQRTMLHASAELALAYVVKEDAEVRVAGLVEKRDHNRQERAQVAVLAQTVRGEWQVQQEHIHHRELEANELRHRRDSFADRLREDYQVELDELYQQALAEGRWSRKKDVGQDCEPAGSEFDASAANQEIEDLRRKLNRLGSVNLEALQELQELETRAVGQRAQHDDLSQAKRSLEEIISRINIDSKRLFQESFVTIRGHFQELFRKLFGGGMADIVIEDENDVLESGIDIIARPPGKELRSISLMSGGEKTMTAVALLLAIFRSKPSPFCILDEVDAALDEANIGRYTTVLREFLDRSQFIIVTHSKKTMAAADTLYGITMQESGISKQVSVRFEDWPDETSEPDGPKASGA
ncbi:MAG: hypothetical protein FJ271_19230 [Planctomycetes bacterium]|nr:hypothetical protein [Planctomycetota bacterium]